MTCSVAPKPTLSASELIHVYGRNIELAMARLDLTTQDIAEAVGITTDALNRIKRNTKGRYIDPEVLFGLAKLFNCTIEELLLPAEGMHYSELSDEARRYYRCA